jgi:hypothetical protein
MQNVSVTPQKLLATLLNKVVQLLNAALHARLPDLRHWKPQWHRRVHALVQNTLHKSKVLLVHWSTFLTSIRDGTLQ